MNTRLSKSLWWSGLVGLFLQVLPAATPARATPPLAVQITGGEAQLSLVGDPGSVWSIQFNNDPAQASGWQILTNITVVAVPTVTVDSTSSTASRRFYRAWTLSAPTNVFTTNMVWMPPGSFVMGSPVSELDRGSDETQHPVTLSQGFFVAKHLVTQGDYLALMGSNPSFFTGAQGGTDLGRPVEQVYWFFAVNYCSALTQLEQQAGRLPTNWVYRLPTEAEWEYACRAGTTTRFSFGDDPTYTALPSYAWFSSNSASATHAVGLKLANPAGLFDMHGDVFEWCLDYYGPYPSGPALNPGGPVTGSTRVFRGGSWTSGGRYARSAGRYQADPTTRFNYVGFRVVAAPAF